LTRPSGVASCRWADVHHGRPAFADAPPAAPSAAAPSAAAPSAAAPPAAPPVAAPLYRTTQSVVLGSPDRWDYLTWDAESHRVFAAHESTVTVVDADRLTVVGQIPVAGANGIALVPSLHKGYAAVRRLIRSSCSISHR